MGGRCTRTGHRDVRQRREVGQCPAVLVQPRRQLAVPDPAVDRDRSRLRVELDDSLKRRRATRVAVGVGNRVERMTTPDRANLRAGSNERLHIGNRRRLVETSRAVLDVACPVAFDVSTM